MAFDSYDYLVRHNKGGVSIKEAIPRWLKSNDYSDGVIARDLLRKEGFARVPRLEPSKKIEDTDLYKFIGKFCKITDKEVICKKEVKEID